MLGYDELLIKMQDGSNRIVAGSTPLSNDELSRLKAVFSRELPEDKVVNEKIAISKL